MKTLDIVFACNDNDMIALGQTALNCKIPCRSWYKNQSIFDIYDLQSFNLLVCRATDLNDKHVKKLIDDNPQIQIIIIATSSNIEENISKLDMMHRIQTISIQRFANSLVFSKDDKDDNYKTDILYFSNIPPHLIRRELQELQVFALRNKLVFRAVGREFISNLPNYVGLITELITIKKLLASTKLLIDLDQEMLLNAALVNTFCISNTENKYFPSYYGSEQLSEVLEKYLTDENAELKRTEITKIAHKTIVENYTEYQQLYQIFQGKPELQDKVKEQYESKFRPIS